MAYFKRPWTDYRAEVLTDLEVTVTKEVKPFLDALSAIQGLGSLQDVYGKLGNMYKSTMDIQGEDAEFHDERFAKGYIFRYAVSHILDVSAALCHTTDSGYSEWLLRKDHAQLRVCAIGGGPGSDVAALQAHLQMLSTYKIPDSRPENYELPTITDVCILDRCPSWEKHYNTLLKPSFQLPSAKYMKFEFQDNTEEGWFSEECLQELQQADVVSVVKFVSAVVKKDMKPESQKNYVRAMLQTVCANMKADALLLYVDNTFNVFGDTMWEAVPHFYFEQLLNERFKCRHTGMEPFRNVNVSSELKYEVLLWRKIFKY